MADSLEQSKAPTILLVDDEQTVRELMELRLQRAGINVCLAQDPPSALALLEREKVDLVLSDINMPGDDGRNDPVAGFTLVSQIKEKYPGLLTVLFTDVAIDQYIHEALEHDIGNIISKNENASEIVRSIERLVNGDEIFGLENYIEESVGIMRREIGSFEEVNLALAQLEDYVRQIGFSDARQLEIRMAADEMLFNAVFHPHSSAADVPREKAQEIVLPEGMTVSLTFGGTTERFGVAITDQMGTLTKNTVLKALQRVVLQKEEPGVHPVSQYGRGFYITRALAREYYVNIKRSECTEIIVIFDDDPSESSPEKSSLKINEV